MHIIGLTGGIASGKSTVGEILKEQGAYIVDADQIARDIVGPGQPALKEIQAAFGPDVFLPNGELNRQKLGDVIFRDPAVRHKLNVITHDRIKLEIGEAIEKAAAAGYNIVVLDVPLLIEVGWQYMADTVWVVYVDRETQINRLMERNRLTCSEALDRIQSQMSLAEKKAHADVVIDNSGSLTLTRQQVTDALAELTKEAKTK